MQKLDLHIHTIATISDRTFEFCIENLKKYVMEHELDCIAITNHNLFDYSQFKIIKEELDIKVFPGIEINIENGHLILISENSDLLDFSDKCEKVCQLIKTKDDSISVEQLEEIFYDLNQYLLIPHYDKKPRCSSKVIDELSQYIVAGEVNSIKKFLYCQRDKSDLTPVYFSDIRIKKDMKEYSPRQTFLDIDEISIDSIKLALRDKNKVHLSAEDGHKLFEVLDNGLKISTGLTVMLGERSSGKTYTLNQICDNYDNVKYIKQFSLLETEETRDKKKFDDILAKKQGDVMEDFLKEFKEVVEEINNIDLANNRNEIEKYINSLLKNANERQRDDAFSKAKLFNEIEYAEDKLQSLKELISAVQILADNVEYERLISTYIAKKDIYCLVCELMNEFIKKEEVNLQKRWVNELVHNIKAKLKMRTAVTSIEDIDFNRIMIENEKVKKFQGIVKDIQKETVLQEKDVYGFKVVASVSKFNGAGELKNFSGKQVAFSNAYDQYDSPYRYLKELKRIGQIYSSDYYKYFTKITFKILNKYGFEVSGGERSEFNLLNEINNATQYDMLLIDEPESSFDNLFLKNSVNEIIKNLSKSIPVILVTHNNTVGASIKPDYIVYTKKEVRANEVEYDIYSGYPTNKALSSLKGKTTKNHNILLNCLEAGESTYKERGQDYEMLED